MTSLQLLPGGCQALAGCMDGTIQLLDLRCAAPAAQQLSWGHAPPRGAPGHPAQEGAEPPAPPARFWWRRRAAARLCAARCHEWLLAAGGDAHGIATDGLRWPLDGDDLPAHSTRGVSNELASDVATVSLRAGRLLVIQPAATEH